MTNEELPDHDPTVTCSDCQACCCRLQVMLITETGVPADLITKDKTGVEFMAQGEDGWCVAVDRTTMKCTIYGVRPWVCREFVMGDYECLLERSANSPLTIAANLR